MKKGLILAILTLALFAAVPAVAQTEETKEGNHRVLITAPTALLGEWELQIIGKYLSPDRSGGEIFGSLAITLNNIQEIEGQIGVDYPFIIQGSITGIANSYVCLVTYSGENYVDFTIFIENPLVLIRNPASNTISLGCRLFIFDEDLMTGVFSGSFERRRGNRFAPEELYHGEIHLVRPWRVRG